MSIALKGIVEGLLFASGEEGMTLKQIARTLEITEEMTHHLIEELEFDYEHVNRGIHIMQSYEVFHLTTKPEHSAYYKKLQQDKHSSRMSRATLETLSIVAYEQPITKIDVDEIRGVQSDYAIQNLLKRSLIETNGRKDTPGRPYLYRTTKEFLNYFGFSSLQDLPTLPEAEQFMNQDQTYDLFDSPHHDQLR